MNRAYDYIAARGETLFKADGVTRKTFNYKVEGRDDFNDFMHFADKADGCETKIAWKTVGDVNRFDPILGEDPSMYARLRLSAISMYFLHGVNSNVLGKQLTDKAILGFNRIDEWTNDRRPAGTVRRHMETVWSLHQLQKQEFFTSFMSILIAPNGNMTIHPGTTRRIFGDTRTESFPVAVFDYRRPEERDLDDTWLACEDFVRPSYDGLEIRSATFSDKFYDQYRYFNLSRYLRFIETYTINKDYRIGEHNLEDFEFAKDSKHLYVNGTPLCERDGEGNWRMIPHAA